MIGNDRFVQVFGSVPAGDAESLVQVVSNAVREGFAVVLLKPGTKIPVCTLNTRDRKAADTLRQNEAREIGDKLWYKRRHPCGVYHALTVEWAGDPAKVRTKVGALIRRVMKENAGAPPNIGVELGRSRRLVVDVDTDAENYGFQLDWANACPDPDVDPQPGMTVKSPGVQDISGEWKHKNGGHYWFTIPDGVELPAGDGVFAAPSGWVAMWADHQVLVPPSVRPEGPYELVGQESEAPGWLIETILAGVRARMDRAKSRTDLPDGTADIDIWAANTPWADLLDDWIDTGLPDRCSCPIWTAPGVHGSPKSATAHDVGCDRYDSSPGHAPLHVWTDNPPPWMAESIHRTGSKTFTKLGFLAARDHDGVIAPTLADLGMAPGVDSEFPGYGPETPPEDFALPDFDDPGRPGGDAEELPELTQAEILRKLMIGSAGLDSIADPEPLVAGFLDLDTIARVTGKSGHGKSFIMLDMAGAIATGQSWHGAPTKQGLVVYMVAEGVRGWKRRMRAWERVHHDGIPIPDAAFLIVPMPIQSAETAKWHTFVQVLTQLQPVLVVLDTQARVTVGVDENDATAMGVFIERMEQIRRATGACVVAVHHLGHAGEHGRGSTAVIGALGAEIRVVKVSKGHLTVETEKQKDGEELAPLKFVLEPAGDSVVPMPDGWSDDPLDPVVVPVDAPRFVLARDQLAAIIWTYFPHDGATQAKATGLLIGRNSVGEPWTEFGGKSKPAAYKAWDALIGAGVLLQVKVNGKLTQRFKLAPKEAERLELADPETDPRLPDGTDPERAE